jgi:hypothetical protein
MSDHNLTYGQLADLLDAVFRLRERERWLTVLVDLPDDRRPDHPAWQDRRALAAGWFEVLHTHRHELPFTAMALAGYPHVGSNNNGLPAEAAVAFEPCDPGTLQDAGRMPMEDLLAASSVVLAPTELSATAPLKLLAKRHGFRGATMPGFTRAMLPVLSLDYEQVNARVMELKSRLDRADGMRLRLEAGGSAYHSFFDLRFRSAHASGGLLREPGTVGNLPSGEAYIVPYEGEREGEPSRTAGELPVQFGDEIVVYRLDGNRATGVVGDGPRAGQERQLLLAEPAYGNMAEVGLGVLGAWGVEAVGSTLLDEKLGLHIAFGRSDHFGGAIGPASFTDRDRVVHVDRVFVPSTQPAVVVAEAVLVYPGAVQERIILQNEYVV